MAKTTSKKTKYIGNVEYINPRTGELETFQLSEIEERDANFHKIWMREFIASMEIVGNKKTKICYWVIDNINKSNELTYTYRQISKATGISLETVRATMAALQDADFLRRKNQGCYVINPNIIYKGSRNGRLNILHTYRNIDQIDELSKQEKIINLQRSIAKMQKEIERLMGLEVIESEEKPEQLPGQTTFFDKEEENA